MELELAKGLKKDFDTRFHPTWQCVVGKFIFSKKKREKTNFYVL
jgi:hypothetical protein